MMALNQSPPGAASYKLGEKPKKRADDCPCFVSALFFCSLLTHQEYIQSEEVCHVFLD
jgi:hypothetical protein